MLINKIVLTVLTIVFLFSGCTKNNKSNTYDISNTRLSFIMIHLEAGYEICKTGNIPPNLIFENICPEDQSQLGDLRWQEFFWPAVVDLIVTADHYGFKLTLALNPQWGDYIKKDSTKIDLVSQWRAEGHEIGFHHHSRTHIDWNGYSNDSNDATDSLYLGDANKGFTSVNELVAPDDIIVSSTLSVLPLDFPSLLTPPEGQDMVFGEGNASNSYGAYLKSLKPTRDYVPAIGNIVHLTIREFSTAMDISLEEALPILEEQYINMSNDEVFGIVWHECDYFLSKDSYIKWFNFIKSHGGSVKTMRVVADEYFNQ